jgi:hypothetical protein
MNNLDKGVNLAFSIYSANLEALISIYRDVEPLRESKVEDYIKQLESSTWSRTDFQDFSHYDMHFKWNLLHALFIAGFSYFENYLRTVAEYIEKTKGENITLRDIRGSGDVDRYRKYINLIGGIDMAGPGLAEWSKIKEFKAIRNAIIHKSGVIKKKISVAVKHDIYFGPGMHTVRIKNINFLEDFVTCSTDYMKSITKEIDSTGTGTG